MGEIKNRFRTGIAIGILIGMGLLILPSLLVFYVIKDHPNGRFSQWAKNEALTISQVFHPMRQIRNYAQAVRDVAELPKLKALSKFSFQKIGYSGSRAERSGNFTTWITSFSDRVPPADVPPPNRMHASGKTRPINITGLKGEVLSFQFIIRSLNDEDHLTVALEPSTSSLSRCITIHRFREIYMKLMVHQGGKYGPLKEVINPDPLVPFTDPYLPGHTLIHEFSIKNNYNQPIWFDIHFLRNCTKGSYTGTLVLKSSGGIVRESPVVFNVLDATLPKRVDLDRWMEFYNTRFWRGEQITTDQEFQTLFLRYFVKAHKYGFSINDCGEVQPGIQWDWNTGKAISTDWTKYDQLFEPILSGQLTGSSPNTWCFPIKTYSLGAGNWGGFMIEGGSPSPIENWNGIPDIAAQNLARLIIQHWKEKGWPISQGIAYPFDEPAHQLYYSDIYRLVAKVADSLHKGSDNQMRVMLTDAPWPWYKTQVNHHKSDMYDKIDIWAPSSEVYIPDRFKKYQEDGKRVWFYQSGPPFIGGSGLDSTGIGFRMWFWAAWKYHSNGVYYWAMNFWDGHTVAVNPYTNARTGDGVMFYPGHQLHIIGIPDIDGPVPSIRSSQWRRGYEDYKYLVMLKEKGDEADADHFVNGLVVHALNDGGYIPYWRNPLWWKAGDWDHDPRSWHKARLSMAQKIVSLYGGSN